MDAEISHQPDSAIARVTLGAGEELVAEAGCMIAMSGYINASITLRQGKGGGILGGLKRMVAGESLFLSVFRSSTIGGCQTHNPGAFGQMVDFANRDHLRSLGRELLLQVAIASVIGDAGWVPIRFG